MAPVTRAVRFRITQSLVNHDMRHQPSGTLLLTSSAERIVLSSDPSQVREVVREDPRKETQPAQVDQPTGDVLGRRAVIPPGPSPSRRSPRFSCYDPTPFSYHTTPYHNQEHLSTSAIRTKTSGQLAREMRRCKKAFFRPLHETPLQAPGYTGTFDGEV